MGCYLTSIGSLDYPPGTPYPCKGHPQYYAFKEEGGRVIPEYALVFILSGAGMFEAAGIPSARVGAGSMFYIVPGAWHRYSPIPGTGWSERWLTLNGTLLHQLRNSATLSDRSQLLQMRDAGKCLDLLQRLLDEVGGTPRRNKPAWGLRAMEVLLEAFENAQGAAVFDFSEPPEDTLVARAVDFINNNCHRSLGVTSVAAHCGIPRRTLERHFLQNGKQSVAREIALSRIQRAEMLLRESSLPVKEIAYACGFGTAQRMLYSFHRNRGYTPGSLRR